jgi:AraC family transcriptional regulator, transcriptional activator of pobA
VHYQGRHQELLMLEEVRGELPPPFTTSVTTGLTFVWFVKSQSVKVDGLTYLFQADQILCLTEFHHLDTRTFKETRFIRFNRPFYCVKDHDDEVGCRGLLFFSAAQLPVITIPKAELEKFELLWKMFALEMGTRDNLQFEMLQMMLKRFIILCTRLYKHQHNLVSPQIKEPEIIRAYNLLVEQHYKTQHTVAFYASQLHKSPKTLANLFLKYGLPRPLEIIQERIMLEARRLLRYTDKSIKEVAYQVGYEDLQSFSRAFRTHEKISPTAFKDKNFSVNS